jgi:hypothetical protein
VTVGVAVGEDVGVAVDFGVGEGEGLGVAPFLKPVVTTTSYAVDVEVVVVTL